MIEPQNHSSGQFNVYLYGRPKRTGTARDDATDEFLIGIVKLKSNLARQQKVRSPALYSPIFISSVPSDLIKRRCRDFPHF